MTGYPLTFFVMLCVSLVTCTMTTKIKQQEQFRMESEREKMRANLLRSVSHDIRTPLTSTSSVQPRPFWKRPTCLSNSSVQLLEDVRDDAQWLVRVVENLLSITRMGEDTRMARKQPEAAEEVLGEVARKFRKHYPDVKISVAVPDELLIVPMDAILIEQVMTNLLENAVRHGKNTTHIALSVHQEGEKTPSLPCRTTAAASRPSCCPCCSAERCATATRPPETASAIWEPGLSVSRRHCPRTRRHNARTK